MRIPTGFLPLSILILMIRPSWAAAQWDAVTAKDWTVSADTAIHLFGAEMLLEKIEVDDRDLEEENVSYLTLYRRTRVYSAEGRRWGAAKLPYLAPGQHIEWVEARVVLPGGQTIRAPRNQLPDKSALRAWTAGAPEMAFAFPGMTDNCIVEYAVKYRLPGSLGTWMIQKDIPLRRGELTWIFFRPSGKPDIDISLKISGLSASQGQPWFNFPFMARSVIPNHIWLNVPEQNATRLDILPTALSPNEIRFSIEGASAFRAEPFTSAEVTLRTQLRYYYSDDRLPLDYWQARTRIMNGTWLEFKKKRKAVVRLAATFPQSGDDLDRIAAAYRWVQANIRNLSYAGDKNGGQHSTYADDVLKRRRGTAVDITLLFHALLIEMGFDARLTYVVDRRRDFFIPDAKNWPFDGMLVGVKLWDQFHYFAPGYRDTPHTRLPYFFEGIRGFMVGAPETPFVLIPWAPASSNRFQRTVRIRLDEQPYGTGQWKEERTGHHADAERIRLAEGDVMTETGRLSPDPGAPVIREWPVQTAPILSQTDTTRYVEPLRVLGDSDHPFKTNARTHDILLPFAEEAIDAVHIDLPNGWRPDTLPADVQFTNKVGACHTTFALAGRTLTVERRFTVNAPAWDVADYGLVRELFAQRQAMDGMKVYLKPARE